MNPTLSRLFAEYAADHRHPKNQLTHKLAIPVIVFHALAMLHWLELGPELALGGLAVQLSAGHLGWLVASAFYLWAWPRMGVVMALLFALCLPVAAVTPAWVVVVLALLGWTVQLAGHLVWEKNRPSFTRNLVQALVGPIFFAAVLSGAWRPERQC